MKLLHLYMRVLISQKRKFPLYILSPMPEVQGNKIFVMNHGSVHDAPIADEVIKEHFYVLVGKQRLDFMERIFFWINGVVYVDRKVGVCLGQKIRRGGKCNAGKEKMV